jgi:hypothetical protein
LCTILALRFNTGCKRTEMSFHLTHVTKEFHRVRKTWFRSVLHIRRKACTYVGPR